VGVQNQNLAAARRPRHSPITAAPFFSKASDPESDRARRRHMEPSCSVASPLPVARLQGDVLAELDEAAPPPRVPVACLDGEVRDEFLRFLEESRVAAAAAVEPGQEPRVCGGGGADGYDDGGLVVDDDHGSFVDDRGEDGDGDVGDGASAMVEEDDEDAEAVLELLLPHILDLPTFRARAAAPAPSSSSDEEMTSVEEEDASLRSAAA